MTKVLKIKYYKVSTFLDLSQHISFDFLPSLFYFLFGFCRNADLILVFSPISQLATHSKQLERV